MAEVPAPSEEPATEVESMPTLAVAEATTTRIDTAAVPSIGTPIAAEPTEEDRADETAHEVAALAEQIAADSRVDERPELFAQRLQEPGAEGLVHWRRHAKREFRYVLKESFD
ncbi:MAG: hypothetical protein R3B81_05485 [bacterium]